MGNADDLWEHPDWARQKARQNDEDDEGPGLEYIDLDMINNWVVQLTFKKMINNKLESYTGSGFFLNIPNIKDKHVILTAAHNLIPDGIRTLDLKVIYNNPFRIDPANPAKVKFDDENEPPIIERGVDNTINSDQVHICEAYKAGVPSGDYAVIRISRTPAEGPRGFGFSLKLALKKSFKGNVHVSGFKNIQPKPLRPGTSSASSMIYHDNYVEYRATTEQGISGSPVWVEYKGYPNVVAVHNNGPDRKSSKSGSRGALLTVALLSDVFEWLDSKLLLKGVQIQIRPDELVTAKYHTGDRKLFLSFMTNIGFACVRLDSGTKFDWMLAQVDSKNVYYALSVVGEKKWVKFNVAAPKYQGVELSNNMDGQGCLLQNLADADRPWMIFAADTGIVENNAPKKVQLRMEGTRLKTYDANREASQVSLVSNKGRESKVVFYKLIMSPT